MIARSLLSDIKKPLQGIMTENEALSYFTKYNLQHLPVINNDNKLIGILSLDQIKKNLTIKNQITDIQNTFLDIKIFSEQHIYEIIELFCNSNISSIPVVDETNSYIGLITALELINYFYTISSLNNSGAIIILSLSPKDYSLSKISQIVEENNVKIISLYTNFNKDFSQIEITLKLNTHEIGEIIESFNRFDYTITTYFKGVNKLEDLYIDRIENLKNYLEI
jgi:acetoin utilization protein AcuB